MKFENKSVFVTGADGFIGSHLTEALIKQSSKVKALCIYNSNGSCGWIDTFSDELRNNIEIIHGDIRDARYMEECCRNVDIVFHLAALIAIPYSYMAPESFYETNVRGTLNILEAVKRNNCCRMIHTSTSEVYGTPASIPINESFPLQGQSPYSASKIASDKICEAYYNSYDVPVVILRPFNTYGPRQSTRAVLPTIITQLLSQKTSIKLGATSPKRDMTFVEDTVQGFLKAAYIPNIEGETIQLGTGNTHSIKELFEICCKIIGIQSSIETDHERYRPLKSEVAVLLSDPAKAKNILGWSAKVSIEEGLQKTIDWIRSNLHLFRVNHYHR